jgi:hypothetical protein
VEAKKAERAKKAKRLEPFVLFCPLCFFASLVSSPHTRSGKVPTSAHNRIGAMGDYILILLRQTPDDKSEEID